MLSPAFNLLANNGVPGPLLGPDNGVPDLDPGLARPEGNLEPLGVNIGTRNNEFSLQLFYLKEEESKS